MQDSTCWPSLAGWLATLAAAEEAIAVDCNTLVGPATVSRATSPSSTPRTQVPSHTCCFAWSRRSTQQPQHWHRSLCGASFNVLAHPLVPASPPSRRCRRVLCGLRHVPASTTQEKLHNFKAGRRWARESRKNQDASVLEDAGLGGHSKISAVAWVESVHLWSEG